MEGAPWGQAVDPRVIDNRFGLAGVDAFEAPPRGRNRAMATGPEPVLLSILIIILGAKLGGELAERFKQPAVLGELLVGVLLGASLLGGFIGMPDFGLQAEHDHLLEELHAQPALSAGDQADLDQRVSLFERQHGTEITVIEILSALATIGVILLLFEVGLESDVRELTKVGRSSLVVALIGVVVSFAVGYGFSHGLSALWSPWQAAGDALPDHLLHTFVGATLTATSVGITARVLGDMGHLKSREARIILGAAVIDDIAGLIILAIVAAMVAAAATGGDVSTQAILLIAGKAVGFLVVSLVVGLRFVPRFYDGLVARFRVRGFPVALAIAFALFFAYAASLFGLADIVGAFAAGLLLAQTKHAHHIFEDLRPIAAIFVSFFFITLGMKVDLTELGGNALIVVGVGLAMTLVALGAKLACGWGVQKDAGANRLVVGVGMAPRGEVGLIFAGLGLATGLIHNWQYTTIIIVVMLTTFITPIWLERMRGSFRGGTQEDGHGTNMSKIMEV